MKDRVPDLLVEQLLRHFLPSETQVTNHGNHSLANVSSR